MLAEIFGLDGVIVVIVIVVVLVGGAAIPKLARNLGSAQGEFKKGLAEGNKLSEESKNSAATDLPAKDVAEEKRTT